MPYRSNLSRLGLAVLASALVATPAATALPVDPTGPAPADMRSAPADLRGESAASGGTGHVPAPGDPDDGGLEPVVVLLIGAGALALGGGGAVAVMRLRPHAPTAA